MKNTTTMENNIKFPIQYKNGNTDVELHRDGTKIRTWPDGEDSTVILPESCDLLITKFCDLGDVCQYCHEAANLAGKHGDLKKAISLFKDMFPGSELAIGGGNPLSHPDLMWFLQELKNLQIIPNLTVNMLHLMHDKFLTMLCEMQNRKLVYGLGLSYRGVESLETLPSPKILDYRNVVFHCILGVHTLEDINSLLSWCKTNKVQPKILLLGYKTYRKGASFYSEKIQKELDIWEHESIGKLLERNGIVISFDNLAIAQLKLQEKMSEKDWGDFFMGTDGVSTAYCDLVSNYFARTSTSTEKHDIEGRTLKELFDLVRFRSV